MYDGFKLGFGSAAIDVLMNSSHEMQFGWTDMELQQLEFDEFKFAFEFDGICDYFFGIFISQAQFDRNLTVFLIAQT